MSTPPLATVVCHPHRLAGTVRAKAVLALLLVLTLGAAGVGLPPERAPQPKPPEEPAAPEGKAALPRLDRRGDPLPDGAVARLGTRRLRHAGAFGVAYSPDGKLLATSGSSDHIIRFWEPSTGKELRRLVGHTDGRCSLVFSPDGKTLASGSFDNTIRLWDVASGRPLRTMTEKGGVTTVTFAPDGKALASGSWNKVVRLWDAATGQCLRTFEGHTDRVSCVAFAPDGKTLASSGWEDRMICLWEVGSGKRLREFGGRRHEVMTLHFSPDGKTLASGGKDGPIHLWDAATGEEVRQLVGHPSFVEKVIFTRDGKTLVSASYDHTIRVWDVAAGKQVRLLGRHLDMVYGLSLSPDEKTVASAGQDNLVRLWDLASGKEVRHGAGHENAVTSVQFSRDGRTLTSTARDGTLRLWRLATGEEVQRWGAVVDTKDSPSDRIALSPDGRILAVADKQTVRLRDRMTGEERAVLKASAEVRELRFSPDGKTLAAATNRHTVHLWDVATRKERGRVEADTGDNLLFSPDGRFLATEAYGNGLLGLQSKAVQFWDVATGKRLRRIEGKGEVLLPLAVSRDGRMVAGWEGGPGNTLVVWETATGGERARFRAHRGWISAAAFSPDGRTLASGSWDQTVRVWDLLTGEQRHCFHGAQGAIQALDFSADGRCLASGGENTTVLVWSVNPPRQIAPTPERSAQQWQALWDDLAAADAARAFQAMKAFQAAPARTVGLLRDHLRPVAAPDAQRVARLLADLDSEQFAVREKATQELEKLGDAVEPQLRKALQGQPSLELRRRLDRLLEKLSAESPDRLRTVRALEVLERLNTPESRRLLEQLAGGVPGAWLTREARASLDRLPSP